MAQMALELRSREDPVMRLNAKAMAMSVGIVSGASVFLATVWILVTGSSGETMSGLGVFYLGYSVSWGGAFIGLVYGLIDGLIGGLLFALLYNAFVPKEQEE